MKEVDEKLGCADGDEHSMRMFPFYYDQHGWGYVIGDFSEVRDPKHAGGSDAICDADANHFGGVSLSSEVGNQIPPFPPLPPVCCDYFKVIFYFVHLATASWILQV